MAVEKRLKERDVLVLAAEGERRDALAKALRREDFKPHFIGVLNTAVELLASLQPATFLHDWPTVDPSLAIGFQQRLGKNPSFAGLCRVIYIETVTPSIAALASDSGVRRVVSYAKNPAALVGEIKMALNSLKSMSEMQRLVQEIQAGATYDQDVIDTKVEKAFEVYPHDPGVRLEYGLLSLRRKYAKTAKTIAEGLVEEQPTNVRAMNLLGRVLMMEGTPDKAIELLEKANVLSPLNVDRLLMLGDAFFSVGNTKKAANYYQEALSLAPPGGKEAKTGLAKVKLAENDVNSALEMIRDSVSEEELASLFNNAAVRAAQTGQIEASLRLYKAALGALKSSRLKAAVHFNIALAHERLGQLDDAAKSIRQSLKADPEFDKAIRYQKKFGRLKGSGAA